MNKIKDLFYNVNDIFVVLVILLIAALVISGRVNAIMDYPVTSGAVTEVQEETIPEENTDVIVPEEETNGEGEANQDEENQVQEEAGEATTPDDGYIRGKDGKIYPFSLYIAYGDSTYTVGKNLATLGLFESAEEFERYAEEKGVATKIQAGTFEIPQKSTHEEVINILTGNH